MLTRIDLLELAHSMRDENVLSVYIDGTSHDPAEKQPWRITLDNALRDIRTWLENSTHTEREQFEKAATRLRDLLGTDGGTIGAPGWVAFITPERVRYSEAVRTPLPTLAVWSTGLCISPYARVWKQHRPVLLAVADSHDVDAYRYERGELVQLETMSARTHADAPSHMGNAPRVGFHQGVHGVTGRDALERDWLTGTAKMLREVAEYLVALAGRDGVILVGGIASVAEHLLRQFPDDTANRTLRLDGVDVHMPMSALTAVVERGASTIRNRMDRQRVEEIIDLAASHNRGTLGVLDTRRALDQREVGHLYVTRRFLDEELAEGELAVRDALEQDATVEEVSGDAATLLDDHGGIGAQLRFRVDNSMEEFLAAAEGSRD